MSNEKKKGLFLRIGERFDEFSPKHRILAKYILDHYLDLAYVTVTQLASCAGVSETTVIRFVYSIGNGGFPDFMRDLREEIDHAKDTRTHGLDKHTFDRGAYNFPADAMRAIFTMEMSVMEETLTKIPVDLFEKAVDKINASSMLLIVGCNANKCHTQAAYFAFSVLRPNVRVVEQFDLSAQGLFESIPQNTVCLAFSTPRYPRETQLLLENMKDASQKIFTIGVTDSVSSAIAPYSDMILQIPEKFVMFIDSNAAYVALIHAMAFALYLKKTSYSRKRIEKYDIFVKKNNFYVRDYLDLIDI
ncbi:MAG: MurR/RpiR family transcriptional regulator [Synergistaceae bacterium]|nr:MurR/RpiR family transcriptional regulator [Synergistaceae bacterium]